MINASQARSMAEAAWGRGGTHGQRTNRRGAFYYSCSSHGGYVIDGRCLPSNEFKQVAAFLRQWDAREVIDHRTPNTVRQFRGPHSTRRLTYGLFEYVHNVPIFFAEEDADWAVIEHYTSIRLRDHIERDPIPTLERYFWK